MLSPTSTLSTAVYSNNSNNEDHDEKVSKYGYEDAEPDIATRRNRLYNSLLSASKHVTDGPRCIPPLSSYTTDSKETTAKGSNEEASKYGYEDAASDIASRKKKALLAGNHVVCSDFARSTTTSPRKCSGL